MFDRKKFEKYNFNVDYGQNTSLNAAIRNANGVAKMNAEKFYSELIREINNLKNDDKNKYSDLPEWTRLVNKEIVPNILKPEKLEVDFEYYRIDVIGWEQKKTEEIYNNAPEKFNTHLWKLAASIEHENDDRDWMDEVVKLAWIRCPLRVVIGYTCVENNNGERADKDKKRLDFVAVGLRKLSNFMDKNDNFMVILGSCGNYGADFPNYIPYLYENGSFKIPEWA